MTFQSLDFSDEFLEPFGSRDFTSKERALFLGALRLLAVDEKHPSLRVHALGRDLKGLWSASASLELRITFQRTANGRKTLVACTRHCAGTERPPPLTAVGTVGVPHGRAGSAPGQP